MQSHNTTPAAPKYAFMFIGGGTWEAASITPAHDILPDILEKSCTPTSAGSNSSSAIVVINNSLYYIMEQALYPYIATADKLRLTEVNRSWRHTFKHALYLQRTCSRVAISDIWSLSSLADTWEAAYQSSDVWVERTYRRYWHRAKRAKRFPLAVEALLLAGD
mgnify:FL=1